MSVSETKKVAALGQPFTLGMLYNACKDELIPGLNLWDAATLESHTSETAQKSSSFKITASDTIESRSSLMDIEASLKLSFLGGLVEVGGSAKYLNDQKKFKNQSRVSFQYKATTNFKQLSVPALGPLNSQQKQIIEKGKATHIVTGILYGANAVFVFDSEKLESSSVQDIQGNMEAVIKKIPSFSLEGSARVHLSKEEQDLTNKFSCKFFGDLILDTNPATFNDAVKAYCELPALMAQKDNRVPLVVWLYPLKLLYDEAPKLIGDLSIALARKIQTAMEDGNEVEMRCNESLYSSVAREFTVIHKNLNSFKNLCSFYTSSIKLLLAKSLPAIRDGKQDESALAKVLNDREKSPFSQEHLTKWLDSKERDINVIRSCVDMIMRESNACVVRTKTELDRVVLAPGVTNVLVYVFTSVDPADPYLDAMAKYLDTSQLQETGETNSYFTNADIIQMREDVQTFLKYAKPLRRSSSVKFLITALPNKKYKASSIYHYKDGLLFSDKFTVPSVPAPDKITDRNQVIWHAIDLTLDENTVDTHLTLSEGNKKATNSSGWSFPINIEWINDQARVLCKEGMTGRHYWEVEWRGETHVVAAYSSALMPERKFGDRFYSWGFQVNHDFEILGSDVAVLIPGLFEIGIKSESTVLKHALSGIQKIGVFLDWPGGTLSFYGVSGNKMKHYYTFNKAFDEPIYAGFAAYYHQSYALLSSF
ncbi:neoverrucotoxin subunit alpha-like [Dunckerocampus dactyliophorus]|uniref:neoverrucotoxin subunit alpha-like n=1 Tax=Dunckerocampus dactyliophorus TaxID=161453 RepID=UPI002405798A|nr:neoverrucotoxin subunit alpha-like [Dunckerocampus dactyliophorus]